MALVSEKKLIDDVFEAAKLIDSQNDTRMPSTSKNIQLFLMGRALNPFNSMAFNSNPLGGSYKDITLSEISEALRFLLKKKMLFKNRENKASIYSTVEKRKQKEAKIDKSNAVEIGKEIPFFYETCSKTEKKLIDGLIALLNFVEPAFVHQDRKTYYGFYAKNRESKKLFYWFWVLRSKEGLLVLKMRERPTENSQIRTMFFNPGSFSKALKYIGDVLKNNNVVYKKDNSFNKMPKTEADPKENENINFYEKASQSEKNIIDSIVQRAKKIDDKIETIDKKNSFGIRKTTLIDGPKSYWFWIARDANGNMQMRHRVSEEDKTVVEIPLSQNSLKDSMIIIIQFFERQNVSIKSAHIPAPDETIKKPSNANNELGGFTINYSRMPILQLLIMKSKKLDYSQKCNQETKKLVDSIPITMGVGYKVGGIRYEFYTMKNAEKDYKSYKIDLFVKTLRLYEQTMGVEIIQDLIKFRESLSKIIDDGINEVALSLGLYSNFKFIPSQKFDDLFEYFAQFEEVNPQKKIIYIGT